MRKLEKELKQDNDEVGESFHLFWDEVNMSRLKVNETCKRCERLKSYGGFSGVGDGSIDEEVPRTLRNDLRDVANNDGHKYYWHQCYIDVYNRVIEEVQSRMNIPGLKVFLQIENVLLTAVISDEEEYHPAIDEIVDKFGSSHEAPLA